MDEADEDALIASLRAKLRAIDEKKRQILAAARLAKAGIVVRSSDLNLRLASDAQPPEVDLEELQVCATRLDVAATSPRAKPESSTGSPRSSPLQPPAPEDAGHAARATPASPSSDAKFGIRGVPLSVGDTPKSKSRGTQSTLDAAEALLAGLPQASPTFPRRKSSSASAPSRPASAIARPKPSIAEVAVKKPRKPSEETGGTEARSDPPAVAVQATAGSGQEIAPVLLTAAKVTTAASSADSTLGIQGKAAGPAVLSVDSRPDNGPEPFTAGAVDVPAASSAPPSVALEQQPSLVLAYPPAELVAAPLPAAGGAPVYPSRRRSVGSRLGSEASEGAAAPPFPPAAAASRPPTVNGGHRSSPLTLPPGGSIGAKGEQSWVDDNSDDRDWASGWESGPGLGSGLVQPSDTRPSTAGVASESRPTTASAGRRLRKESSGSFGSGSGAAAGGGAAAAALASTGAGGPTRKSSVGGLPLKEHAAPVALSATEGGPGLDQHASAGDSGAVEEVDDLTAYMSMILPPETEEAVAAAALASYMSSGGSSGSGGGGLVGVTPNGTTVLLGGPGLWSAAANGGAAFQLEPYPSGEGGGEVAASAPPSPSSPYGHEVVFGAL